MQEHMQELEAYAAEERARLAARRVRDTAARARARSARARAQQQEQQQELERVAG